MREIYHECQHCGRTVYVEDVEDVEDGEEAEGRFKRVYDEDCGCEAERLRAEQAHYDEMMNND